MPPKGGGGGQRKAANSADASSVDFSRKIESASVAHEKGKHLDEIHDKTLQKRSRAQPNRRDLEQKVDRNMKLRFFFASASAYPDASSRGRQDFPRVHQRSDVGGHC